LSGKIFVTLSSVFLIALGTTGANAAECGSVDQASPDAVRNEVNRLFNKTLDATEYVLPSGVKVATWTGWEHSTQDQIACLGPAAVPATAELLQSTTRSFGRFLAVHMLGWERGPDIVPFLAAVLAKPGSPEKLDTVKLAAIEALAAAPPEQALPVVEQVLHSEQNADLLKAATHVKQQLEELR
jgi:hypothetical protein